MWRDAPQSTMRRLDLHVRNLTDMRPLFSELFPIRGLKKSSQSALFGSCLYDRAFWTSTTYSTLLYNSQRLDLSSLAFENRFTTRAIRNEFLRRAPQNYFVSSQPFPSASDAQTFRPAIASPKSKRPRETGALCAAAYGSLRGRLGPGTVTDRNSGQKEMENRGMSET